MKKTTWKVGELAKATGITVRTLHHYDEIGLLSPSRHSESGHRLYSEPDVLRLQRIMSLKQLGFALDEIRELINDRTFNPVANVRMQLERLTIQIRTLENLRSQLEELYGMLTARRNVTADQLIKLIEVMTVYQNYFTPEQLDKLKRQRESLSAEERKQVDTEWTELAANFREEMEKGTRVDDPVVLRLAEHWNELNSKFTTGEPEMLKAAERFYAENPNKVPQYGIDRELYDYIKKAMLNI